jgi:hypothetical protein
MKRLLPILFCIQASAQPVAPPTLGGTQFGFGGFCLGAIVGGLTFYWAKSHGDHQRRRHGREALGNALTIGGAAVGLALFYILAFKL